jgi:hypothetical protein
MPSEHDEHPAASGRWPPAGLSHRFCLASRQHKAPPCHHTGLRATLLPALAVPSSPQLSLTVRFHAQAYWQLLLREYRALQAYNASLHPDAVPLEESILLPQLVNVTQRACRVCRPTTEQLAEQRRADLGLKAGEPLPKETAPAAKASPPWAHRGAGGLAGQQPLELVQLGTEFKAAIEAGAGSEA